MQCLAKACDLPVSGDMSLDASKFKPDEWRSTEKTAKRPLPLGREARCSRGQFSFYDAFRSRLSCAKPLQLAADDSAATAVIE